MLNNVANYELNFQYQRYSSHSKWNNDDRNSIKKFVKHLDTKFRNFSKEEIQTSASNFEIIHESCYPILYFLVSSFIVSSKIQWTVQITLNQRVKLWLLARKHTLLPSSPYHRPCHGNGATVAREKFVITRRIIYLLCAQRSIYFLRRSIY